MAKAKPNLARTQERLSNHKFDTTAYIVVDSGIRRDSSTGRLVPRGDVQKVGESEK